MQIKGVVSLVVESKSSITTTDFHVIYTEHRNLLNGENAIQFNILSVPKAVSSQWEQTNEIKSTTTVESSLKEIPTRLHTTINKYKESVFNGKIEKFKGF